MLTSLLVKADAVTETTVRLWYEVLSTRDPATAVQTNHAVEFPPKLFPSYHTLNASMTDLTVVLPEFPTQQYVHLLPSLEKNLLTTADLITLEAAEVAKRASLPLLDVKRLCKAVLEALLVDLDINKPNLDSHTKTVSLRKTGQDIINSWHTISTLDDEIDLALGGGIPTGYITEVTGER